MKGNRAAGDGNQDKSTSTTPSSIFGWISRGISLAAEHMSTPDRAGAGAGSDADEDAEDEREGRKQG